ncbi:MAG: DsbA family protein [Actinomycetota bacterium]
MVRIFAVVVALLAGGAVRAADDPGYKIDQVMGDPKAPITIVEYASLTCPHCAHFHETTLPKLKQEWIDTGKAKLIYRDFPTAPAGLSVGASMIAHCAGPDRYFGVLSLLFRSQEKWAGAKDPLAAIKQQVKFAGITEDKVDACLKDQELANAIQARAKDANQKFGIDGTPTLMVDGKIIPGGAVPYEELDKALKAAAKK